MLLSRSRLLCLPALAFAAALTVAPVASAQAPPTPGSLPKPDFSGRWRMLKDQSDFGGFSRPDIVVRIIDDHAPALNVHTIQTTGQKTSIVDATYFTDGSITKNVINGREADSKTFWDGDVLVIRTSMKNPKGNQEDIEDRWQLSKDRQTLTMTSHVEMEKGQVDMKMVCAREKTVSQP